MYTTEHSSYTVEYLSEGYNTFKNKTDEQAETVSYVYVSFIISL